jgi:hypothetical protein
MQRQGRKTRLRSSPIATIELNHMQLGLTPASHRWFMVVSPQAVAAERPSRASFYTSTSCSSNHHRCLCLGPLNAARANVHDRCSGWHSISALSWCVQLGLVFCSGGRTGQLSSPLAARGWQPLAVTIRLTCVYTEQSSHRLVHEACSVDRPAIVLQTVCRIACAAWMHTRCSVRADTRLRA